MRRNLIQNRAWSSGDREDPDEGPSQANSKRTRSELPSPVMPILIASDTDSNTSTEYTTSKPTSKYTKVQGKTPWKSPPQQPQPAETLAQTWYNYTNPDLPTSGYHNTNPLPLIEEEVPYTYKPELPTSGYYTKRLDHPNVA